MATSLEPPGIYPVSPAGFDSNIIIPKLLNESIPHNVARANHEIDAITLRRSVKINFQFDTLES